MLSEPSPEPKSPLKNLLIYSSAAVALVLLAVVFTLYSRWLNNRNFDRAAAQQRAEKQREQDRAAVEQLGGKQFAILMFYASPRDVRRGESAQLCYGVSNAKSVTLEPQAHEVWPSVSNCVDVSPNNTTTYTLTIADAAGNKKSEAVEIQVR